MPGHACLRKYLSYPRRAKRIINGLRERGVLIGSEGPEGHVLKLRPPMCFGREHADRVISTLSAVLADPA